ncbi:MAG: YigZ family protein [Wenzhouxiangellaceae bacterium]|nr:YigZ family protein [Wenzhouxiangellaceae bacterium]
MNVLTGIGRHEQVVRKSRFVAVCGPVESPEAAARFVAEHGPPDCRHVCWAWRIGDRVRFDDAGEPGGTAGRPILAAIDHFGLDLAVAVVSRYFGGVKLGTGGLARAYGGSAMAALDAAPSRPVVETSELRIRVPFDASEAAHRLLDEAGGEKLEERWSTEGPVLGVRVPSAAKADLVAALNEATRGAVEIETRQSETD